MTLIPASAVDALERTMRAGEAEHGERWRTRSVAHHVGKAMGHAARACGPRPVDVDTGLPHLWLAATRLVLAVAVSIEQDC